MEKKKEKKIIIRLYEEGASIEANNVSMHDTFVAIYSLEKSFLNKPKTKAAYELFKGDIKEEKLTKEELKDMTAEEVKEKFDRLRKEREVNEFTS